MMSKGATVKLHNWSPQAPPEFDSLEMKEYRNLIVEAVETIYAINEQTTVEPFKAEAVSHDQIYFYLKNKIGSLIMRKQWPFQGWIDKEGNIHIRPADTVERRVRECASLEYGAKIVAERAGMFVPRKIYEDENNELTKKTVKNPDVQIHQVTLTDLEGL